MKEKVWHRAIFPGGNPQSIFAAATFHSRVRDGFGVEPLRHRHQTSLWVLCREEPSRLQSEK